jgi:Zn-dependent protease
VSGSSPINQDDPRQAARGLARGNGVGNISQSQYPASINLDHPEVQIPGGPYPEPRHKPNLILPLLLFALTVASTLAVGAEFARSYAQQEEAFSSEPNIFLTMVQPFTHPALLKMGIPFSFTLLIILLAHELGHFFACRYHRIDVTYPYFIPAPSIFGTFGAFIRIRSPIPTRRALFDVGLSGPVVGFIFAVPALIWGVAHSIYAPSATLDPNALHFGVPPLMRLVAFVVHPNVDPHDLLLDPVGRAAWVGLFVTALNLLPGWQLDGGHILYSLIPQKHRVVSMIVGAAVLGMGIFFWYGWVLWGVAILILSWKFRHPPLRNTWQALDPQRRMWAVIGLLIFILSFTPWPASNP